MINRTALIRLAHSNPALQPRLLQAIEAGMEFKTAEELAAWVKSARSYDDYVQEKKQKGEKPLSKDEWESRNKGEDKPKGDKDKSEDKDDESEGKDKSEDKDDDPTKAKLRKSRDKIKSLAESAGLDVASIEADLDEYVFGRDRPQMYFNAMVGEMLEKAPKDKRQALYDGLAALGESWGWGASAFSKKKKLLGKNLINKAATMISRTQLIRLAHDNPDLQPRLLQAIEAGMEFKTAEDLVAWVQSDKKAASDYYLYVEDKDGHMVMFEGPMSQSQAKSKTNKDKKINELVDDGGSASWVPASSVERDLGSASSAYFTKLPKADKAKLDKALGKKASKTACGEGGGHHHEQEYEVEIGEIGEVEIGEINVNMGGPDDDWTSHLTKDVLDDSAAGMMLAAGPDLVQSYLTPNDGSLMADSEAPFRQAAQAPSVGETCPANPPKGMRVQFANTIEAMMSYSDAPEPGTMGVVAEGRTDGRVATNFEGRVFVKWDNGPTQAIVASHLLVAESKLKTAARNKTANRIRVASIDALLAGIDGGEYVKLAEDTLVHRATKDLWSLRQDAEGFVIERLFDDHGDPLKLG